MRPSALQKPADEQPLVILLCESIISLPPLPTAVAGILSVEETSFNVYTPTPLSLYYVLDSTVLATCGLNSFPLQRQREVLHKRAAHSTAVHTPSAATATTTPRCAFTHILHCVVLHGVDMTPPRDIASTRVPLCMSNMLNARNSSPALPPSQRVPVLMQRAST
jgi:hypothetical protein